MTLHDEKIQRFLEDKVMSEGVREVLTRTFLKQSKDRDVQYLAAKMIAIELLEDAWKELGKHRKDDTEGKDASNPGL